MSPVRLSAISFTPMSFDDAVIGTLLFLYVCAFVSRPCHPLPRWLVHRVLANRLSCILFVSLVPISCLVWMKQPRLVMALATVVVLALGDYVSFVA